MKNGEGTRLQETRQYWNEEAATFDNEPDHGLNDPAVLAAWTKLLTSWQPSPPANILDIGCGTGSLSVVLAQLGHRVTGIDLSPKMISRAMNKAAAANLQISFQVMEASFPEFSGRRFDGIVCRHVLWSLPNVADVLEHWVGLLEPYGRLLLIEGFWDAGGGLHSAEIVAALPASLQNATVENLSHQPDLWGRKVNDERYAIRAEVA